MSTLTERWIEEQAKHLLRETGSIQGLPRTKEQAADAIYYQLGGLIRDTADEHILDPIELRDAIWRKMTLDSAHSRAKKLDIFADIIHVLRAGE